MKDSRESVRAVAPSIAAVALGTACVLASHLLGSDASMGHTVLAEVAAFLVSGAILGAIWPSRFAVLAFAAAAAGPFLQGISQGVVHGSVSKAGLLSTLGGGAFFVIPGLVVFALPALVGAAVGARLIGRQDLGVDMNPRTLVALIPSAAGAACAFFVHGRGASFAFLAPMAGTACSAALFECLRPQHRGLWTLLAVDVPVLMNLAFVLRDGEPRGSHDLWPIELAMTGAVAAIGAVLGVIGGQLLTRSPAASGASGTKRL